MKATTITTAMIEASIANLLRLFGFINVTDGGGGGGKVEELE
jgi:hypothetical protein